MAGVGDPREGEVKNKRKENVLTLLLMVRQHGAQNFEMGVARENAKKKSRFISIDDEADIMGAGAWGGKARQGTARHDTTRHGKSWE